MAELTPDRLAELRRMAEAAPRGPWWGCRDEKPAPEWGPEQEVYDADGRLVCEIATEGDLDRDLAVKDHIATFDPPTALAMLDEIEQLWAENQRLVDDIKFITAPVEVGGGADAYLRAEVERLRREREVLAAAYVDLRGGVEALRPWLETAQRGDMKSCHNQAVIIALALLDGEKGGGDK